MYESQPSLRSLQYSSLKESNVQTVLTEACVGDPRSCSQKLSSNCNVVLYYVYGQFCRQDIQKAVIFSTQRKVSTP